MLRLGGRQLCSRSVTLEGPAAQFLFAFSLRAAPHAGGVPERSESIWKVAMEQKLAALRNKEVEGLRRASAWAAEDFGLQHLFGVPLSLMSLPVLTSCQKAQSVRRVPLRSLCLSPGPTGITHA